MYGWIRSLGWGWLVFLFSDIRWWRRQELLPGWTAGWGESSMGSTTSLTSPEPSLGLPWYCSSLGFRLNPQTQIRRLWMGDTGNEMVKQLWGDFCANWKSNSEIIECVISTLRPIMRGLTFGLSASILPITRVPSVPRCISKGSSEWGRIWNAPVKRSLGGRGGGAGGEQIGNQS